MIYLTIAAPPEDRCHFHLNCQLENQYAYFVLREETAGDSLRTN